MNSFFGIQSHIDPYLHSSHLYCCSPFTSIFGMIVTVNKSLSPHPHTQTKQKREKKKEGGKEEVFELTICSKAREAIFPPAIVGCRKEKGETKRERDGEERVAPNEIKAQVVIIKVIKQNFEGLYYKERDLQGILEVRMTMVQEMKDLMCLGCV